MHIYLKKLHLIIPRKFIKCLTKLFKHLSLPKLGIETKLYLIIFVPITTVLISSGFLFYKNVSRDITQKQYAYMEQILGNINQYLVQHVNTVHNILATIYDNDIHTDEKSRGKLADVFENYRIRHISILDSIYILYSDGTSVSTSNLSLNKLETKSSNVYIEAEKSDGSIFWIPYYTSALGTKVITCARALKDKEGKFIGVVAIDVSLDKLGVIFDSINFGENGKVYIAYDGGTVISYSRYNDKFFGNASSVGEYDINSIQLKETLGKKEGTKIITNRNNEKIMLVYRDSRIFGWSIVGLMKADEVFDNINKIKGYAGWIALWIVIIYFVVSYYVKRFFIKPIKKITASMNIINAGNLYVRVNIKNKDEIGYLAGSFNNMTRRINQLIEELVYTENIKKQYEFKVLQAQINPHFLFNTLNSINMMVVLNRVDEIHPMIVALVNLLKSSIDKTNEFITIREEVENLKSYVHILKVRYADKFDVIYNIDTKVYQYKTLKLILQPLMENAIFHGVQPKEGIGNISVNVYCVGETIKFEVQDDGVGMDTNLASTILYAGPKAHDQGFNSIGIKNVHERVKLYFGKQWGCTIESQKGEGTKITVCFPAISYEGEMQKNEQ